ncbi:hypothetical protein [Amycolatopsis samaneae]|uniref:SH3b domain-containing protein n=1 Tax=Amycolatopsis samaneae TaxID=664691 RepID=A0ABW5GCT7_9PSEU
MKIRTKIRGIAKGRAPRMLAAVALAGAATAGTLAATAPAASAAASPTYWVTVNGARLRDAPSTTHGRIIDSANKGNGFTVYCWTHQDLNPNGWVWYYGNLWGGRTGYMYYELLRTTAGYIPQC